MFTEPSRPGKDAAPLDVPFDEPPCLPSRAAFSRAVVAVLATLPDGRG
ncbi:MAG TPA: hypothetical protein VIG30_04825 [Ktedonobacterales bacterium]